MNLDQLTADWASLWLPPKRLTLSEWAEENFYLSKYSAKQGRIELFGWQREPFDAFTDPTVSTIVLRVGTQLIKTILIQAAIAYAIDQVPGPILASQPDETDARSFSKERIAPMIADCPVLRGKIADKRSRDAGNTIAYKEFPGGSLSIVGAVSPANAGRRSIQYLFCDEIDKYPPSSGKEGSFTELADERTSTFGTRAKRIYSCSPTVPGSVISRKYEASDQRKPWAPCPACGEYQILKWSQVKWDAALPPERKANSARYQCEHCPALWNDYDRRTACERVQWRPSRPFRGVAGFWISHLYSPHKSLAQIVQKWLDAEESGSVDDLRVFINTNLAEDFIDKGEAPEYEKLLDRREDYLGRVPAGVLLVTAGVDVHPDRIEIEIVGWGRRRESWSLDYQILDGRTSEPEVWKKLSLLLGEVYISDAGVELPIRRMFVDSGNSTNEVYAWVRTQQSQRVVAIKGEHRGLLPVGPPSPVDVTIGGRKIKSGLKIRTIQVSFFKSEFYADLKKRRPTDEELAAGTLFPPGYCHFPKDGNYGDEHFKQICAEQLVEVRARNGRTRPEWQQLRARNEALDCRIYARAAAWDLGMDRFQERHWLELESQRGAIEPVAPAEEIEQLAVSAPAPERQEVLFAATPSAPPIAPVSLPEQFLAGRARPQIRLGGF